jgi:pyridinium-3,5-bisthiocarboxylic acid mononucleotide nickel chelatase
MEGGLLRLPPMQLCYFDAFSGISGDMTVGALIDAGADFPALVAALDSLGTGASFRVEKTKRRGMAASKFSVDVPVESNHRHLHHIVEMIENSRLSERARANARLVFQKLAEAEAAVHGIDLAKVHFHEVGAADSIADICGACVALDLLNVEAVATSAVNVGSGTVKTEHGVLPVPAPATSRLLLDRPIYARGPAMELTTPTGAALASALSREFGPMPAMTISSVGYGAGDRDFPEHANLLRATIGRISSATEATQVAVLEANIDDSTPEVLGYTMERLLAAGALDASFEPIFMKKNRPGTLLRVIARPEDREALAGIVMAETSTLGLRIHAAERRVQSRELVDVATVYGVVRMKVASGGGYAPEYEDCRKWAIAAGVPLRQVIAEANQEYLKNRK